MTKRKFSGHRFVESSNCKLRRTLATEATAFRTFAEMLHFVERWIHGGGYTLRLFDGGGKPALPKMRCSKNGNVRSLNPNRVEMPITISILTVVQALASGVVQGPAVQALTNSSKSLFLIAHNRLLALPM
jgi:hypothetical protein